MGYSRQYQVLSRRINKIPQASKSNLERVSNWIQPHIVRMSQRVCPLLPLHFLSSAQCPTLAEPCHCLQSEVFTIMRKSKSIQIHPIIENSMFQCVFCRRKNACILWWCTVDTLIHWKSYPCLAWFPQWSRAMFPDTPIPPQNTSTGHWVELQHGWIFDLCQPASKRPR